MKRRDASAKQTRARRSPDGRFAPVRVSGSTAMGAAQDLSFRLSCSLAVLVALGVLSFAAPTDFARAAPPGSVLPPGMVPVLKNIQSGIGGITTSATQSGNLMTINQNQRSAIINWNQFNIGSGSEVRFVQPDAGARALNRIFDADPSILQGKLTANGQIYLLNRNGILFDRGSQINVGTLIASTLNISDLDFNNGFAGGAQNGGANPFTRFDLFKDDQGNPLPSGAIQVMEQARLTAASQGAIVLLAPAIENRGVIVAPDGQVILAAGQTAYLWQRNTDSTGDPKAGALRGMMVEITAGKDNANVSSLVANSVTNTGTIAADRGNVSIAALAINQQGIISAGSSVVSNGSIRLTARSIVDNPNATTLPDSDTVRRIDRLGSVEFGAGSYTGTPLLTDSGRLSQSDSYSNFQASTVDVNNAVVTSSRDFRSWIHVVGNTIHNQGNIDSPGGTIDLLAQAYTDAATNKFFAPRVFLDTGSIVSAAGDWVDRRMSDNVIPIQRLTSNDLKDAPLQRSGPLLGQAVAVDARRGSPLFDIAPYLDNRQNTVQDKATVGGDIRIEARQGDVTSAAGSVIDVSGGGFRYAGGTYGTSKLIGEDGKIYDLASASPLRRYIGTVDEITRRYYKAGPMGWNLTRSYATRFKTTPTFESGYVQGADAGSLSVVASSVVSLGDWRGGVTLGRYQVNLANSAATPQGGTLTIGDFSGLTGGQPDYGIDRIAFGAAPDLPSGFAVDTPLATGTAKLGMVLPADQFRSASPASEVFAYRGFGKLALYANKVVTVPTGVNVVLPPGGALAAKTAALGGVIELAAAANGAAGGSITVPAGQVSLSSTTVRLGGAQFASDGTLVAGGARIDAGGTVSADARVASDLPVAGGFTARSATSMTDYVTGNFAPLLDDMANSSARPAGAISAPAFSVNAAANSISLSGLSVDLESGSSLSAMGGFRVAANNALAAGNGGKITITSNVGVDTPASPPGSLRLAGNLYGYALGTGATLQIQSRSIGVTDLANGQTIGGDPATGDLKIGPGFFRSGGFTGYTLTGQAGMNIDPNTVLQPAAEGLQTRVSFLNHRPGAPAPGPNADPSKSGVGGIDVTVAGGQGANAIAAGLNLRELAAGERSPANLAFKLVPTNAFPEARSLTLGKGAQIIADPLSSVTFTVQAAQGTDLPAGLGIELLGSVSAPGGSINATVNYSPLLKGAPLSQFDPAQPDQDAQSGLLRLGPGAVLSTRAAFVPKAGGSGAFGLSRQSDGSIIQRQRVQGSLTSGGQIALTADKGRVVTDAGSLLDVSAASATVDLPTKASGGSPVPYAPQTIWSDAGSITVGSTEASRLDGRMQAQAAGQGAGGSFTLNFFRAPLVGNTEFARTSFGHRIVVAAGQSDGVARSDSIGGAPFVTSRISADRLNSAGFGSVQLKSDNSLEFSGSVNLQPASALTLDAPILELRDAPAGGDFGSPVTLSTNHLTLMNSSGDPRVANPNRFAPVPLVPTTVGNGILFANGRLIDLMGSVTINGVQAGMDPATGEAVRSLVLNSTGDIRLGGLPVLLGRTGNASQSADALAGSLNSAADIELKAQQIYPTTLSEFTLSSRRVAPDLSGKLAATDFGAVRILQAPGTPQPVLSAGGKLALAGDQVVQAGTVKAPLGRIELEARKIDLEPGSLTSASLDGLTVPLGETLNGRSWYYDLAPVASAGSFNQNLSINLTSPGEKQIAVRGDSVAIKPGAIVDVSGGGDVQAFEFVAGPGGSRDVLQASSTASTWAVLPSMRLTGAPLDTHQAARSGVATTATPSTYNTIYLSGVSGLVDGYYPLLDAHYALLPGAYQISSMAASAYRDMPVGRSGALLDGTQVISTWRGVAGSDVREARTSGYIVQPGSVARQASQFNLSDSGFFSSQVLAAGSTAPRLPRDAGNLALSPSANLQLLGELRTKPGEGGGSAQVDISAQNIVVLDHVNGNGSDPIVLSGAGTPFVNLGADTLSRLNGSLLLGGTRSDSTLKTSAQQVIVANHDANQGGSPLTLPELLLAATDKVEVRSGAVIDASVPGTVSTATLNMANKGALLRASSGSQVSVNRGSNIDSTAGTLEVMGTVKGKSILFDATRTTHFDGTLVQKARIDNGSYVQIPGSAFSVSAGAVSLGETANFPPGGQPPTGLVLDSAKLASFGALDTLTIHSYSSIDLVGKAAVGTFSLNNLILDAGELAGFQARDAAGNPMPSQVTNQATLSAGTVTLRNRSGSGRETTIPDGTGVLNIAADRIVLAEGDKGIRGFGQVNLVAGTELAQSGKGTITVAGKLGVTTPRIVAASAADQSVSASTYEGLDQFALDVSRPAAATASSIAKAAAEPGGRWAFSGKSVNFATTLDAPAGKVEMAARGSDATDGVVLQSGAAVNAGGFTKTFTDATAYASAGQVVLAADAGGVSLASGAAIDLSGAAGGGDAGRLTVQASKGAVTIAGSVSGTAPKGVRGIANIDALGLPDFSGLNRRLNEGGMTGERVIRQRQGDITVAAGDMAKSDHVSLSADAGSIHVDGAVDASSASGGGRVEIHAKQDLTLNAGSLIDARGTAAGTGTSDPYAKGGKVELAAEQGQLNFAAGATVDVSAGAKGDAGSVTFAAARPAAGDTLPMSLAGTVKGTPGLGATPGQLGAGPQIVIRGDRSYNLSDVTTATTSTFDNTNPVWADYSRFMGNARTIAQNAASGINIAGAGSEALSVRAGIEIDSPAGSAPTGLTLSSAWDLTGSNWNIGNVPALLTLRATGNLNINNSLGLPGDMLPTVQSWSMRLVGGADTQAANPLALASPATLTAANSGDVTVLDNGGASLGKVRSGSGEIDIAAGRDFRLGSVLPGINQGDRAVVYTAGIAQVDASVDPTQRYTSGGGDIRIIAQRDAIGSMTITPQFDSHGNPIDPTGKSGEFINDWLRRTTLPQLSAGPKLTGQPGSWWVYRPNFHHDIGSFGGGDVAIAAGRDVLNLAAVAPTSGRANIETNAGYATGSIDQLPLDAAGNTVLEVRGGGNVDVAAGRNVQGGEYLVAQGSGAIRAGGFVGGNSAPTGLFLMGQGGDPARPGASIRVEAMGDAMIQSISNPTILALTQPKATAGNGLPTVGFGAVRDAFFTYTGDSAAQVISVTGDVSLGRSIAVKPTSTNPDPVIPEWSAVAPPQLSLLAMNGSVRQAIPAGDVSRPINLFPSTAGELTVLAGKDILNLNISALNVLPDTLPLWNHPGVSNFANVTYGLGSAVANIAGKTRASAASDLFSATVPRLAAGDAAAGTTRYAVEAAAGDLVSATLVMPARSSVRAGRDIVSSVLNLQNLSADDISSVVAGRDILQDPLRYRGDPSTQLAIAFAGPGTGIVQSGRSIDLGTSLGIIADGNTRNSSLGTAASARLVALAGVQGKVDVNAVDALMSVVKLFGLMEDGTSAAMARLATAAVAAADSGKATTLDSLDAAFAGLAASGGTKAIRDAAAAAKDSLASVRHAVAHGAPSAMLDALLAGLVQMSGVDTTNGSAVTTAAADAAQSFAKAAFADNTTGPGNVDLYSTKIQTTGGSGIDLLAPGFDVSGNAAGVINAGLPSGSKGNIGITTQTGGAIRAFLSGDFNVNQSKVLTAQGGDIMMYSSDGSIDAGRGALTSRNSSPPRRVALTTSMPDPNDPSKTVTVVIGYAFLPPIDVAGSGIRTVTSDPDGPGPLAAPPPGSIFLFAPKGTINAGEAGIASAGDVTIRANQVLNANAISAAGNSSGVPPADTGSLGTLSTAPMPGASRAGDDPTKSLPQSAAGPGEGSTRLSILVVEVLGFGDTGDDPNRKR